MGYSEKQLGINLNNKINPSTVHDAGDRLGTYYLTDNPKYFEIQRSNNFVFYVSGLTEQFKADKTIENNIYARDNADDVFKLSVKESSVPHFTQSVIEVKRGNNTMKFAGAPSFDNGQVVLDDFIGAGTKEVLLAWQRKSYDVQTEKVGLASDYKKDAYLLEYTPDYQLVRTWKLVGCWISGLSEDSYSHDNNDKRAITATITYDKAFIDTSDVE